MALFPRHYEPLRQAHVDAHKAIATNDITAAHLPRIAVIKCCPSRSGVGENIRAANSTETGRVFRRRGRRRSANRRSKSGIAPVGWPTARILHAARQSARDDVYAAELPSADQCVGQFRKIGPEPLPLTDGQLVHQEPIHRMPNVEVGNGLVQTSVIRIQENCVRSVRKVTLGRRGQIDRLRQRVVKVEHQTTQTFPHRPLHRMIIALANRPIGEQRSVLSVEHRILTGVAARAADVDAALIEIEQCGGDISRVILHFLIVDLLRRRQSVPGILREEVFKKRLRLDFRSGSPKARLIGQSVNGVVISLAALRILDVGRLCQIRDANGTSRQPSNV